MKKLRKDIGNCNDCTFEDISSEKYPCRECNRISRTSSDRADHFKLWDSDRTVCEFCREPDDCADCNSENPVNFHFMGELSDGSCASAKKYPELVKTETKTVYRDLEGRECLSREDAVMQSVQIVIDKMFTDNAHSRGDLRTAFKKHLGFEGMEEVFSLIYKILKEREGKEGV